MVKYIMEEVAIWIRAILRILACCMCELAFIAEAQKGRQRGRDLYDPSQSPDLEVHTLSHYLRRRHHLSSSITAFTVEEDQSVLHYDYRANVTHIRTYFICFRVSSSGGITGPRIVDGQHPTYQIRRCCVCGHICDALVSFQGGWLSSRMADAPAVLICFRMSGAIST